MPFPHELHESFSEELINVFGPEIIVFFKVGPGEQLKAILQTNSVPIRAVAICSTKAQKACVLSNLVQYVKRNRLVALTDAPAKSQALLEWERRSASSATGARLPVTQPVALPSALPPPLGGEGMPSRRLPPVSTLSAGTTHSEGTTHGAGPSPSLAPSAAGTPGGGAPGGSPRPPVASATRSVIS